MTRDEMRQKWLDALRSGEYEQGTCELNYNGSFCCLGVACEVLKDELNLHIEHSSLGSVIYGGYSTIAPDAVVKALGLYSKFGDRYDDEESLASLNDQDKYTFEQIADELETGKFWKE